MSSNRSTKYLVVVFSHLFDENKKENKWEKAGIGHFKPKERKINGQTLNMLNVDKSDHLAPTNPV